MGAQRTNKSGVVDFAEIVADRPSVADPHLRFTHGLISDVVKALETHGYVLADDPRALARTMLALSDLTKVFEGRS